MSVWAAFGFFSLGMIVANLFHMYAWQRYREGRRENRDREERRNGK